MLYFDIDCYQKKKKYIHIPLPFTDIDSIKMLITLHQKYTTSLDLFNHLWTLLKSDTHFPFVITFIHNWLSTFFNDFSSPAMSSLLTAFLQSLDQIEKELDDLPDKGIVMSKDDLIMSGCVTTPQLKQCYAEAAQ